MLQLHTIGIKCDNTNMSLINNLIIHYILLLMTIKFCHKNSHEYVDFNKNSLRRKISLAL